MGAWKSLGPLLIRFSEKVCLRSCPQNRGRNDLSQVKSSKELSLEKTAPHAEGAASTEALSWSWTCQVRGRATGEDADAKPLTGSGRIGVEKDSQGQATWNLESHDLGFIPSATDV